MLSENFDVKGLKNLAYRANNLKLLSIDKNTSITANDLLTISQQFPLLERIQFGLFVRFGCGGSDFDSCVRVLANGCPKLKYFAFKFFHKGMITDIGVTHLFGSCQNLKYFHLNASSEITDNSLFELSEHCPFLEHLSLSHCKFITAKGIISILACCSRLRKLTLEWCTNVEDIDSGSNELMTTSSIHSHLLGLYMTRCKYLSEKTVLHFVQVCPDLRYLYLEGCFSIGIDAERLIYEIHKYNENLNIKF